MPEALRLDGIYYEEDVNWSLVVIGLRRDLMRFDRILVPMEEVARKLARNDLPCVDAEGRPE